MRFSKSLEATDDLERDLLGWWTVLGTWAVQVLRPLARLRSASFGFIAASSSLAKTTFTHYAPGQARSQNEPLRLRTA
jgi:hypothetical protein